MSARRPSHSRRRRSKPVGPAEPSSEIVWLARVCREADTLDGRMRAAEELLFRVGGAVRDFVFRHTPEALAEDVHQEVLTAIAVHVDGFGGHAESEFWGWCYRLARNKIADALRDKGRGGPPVSLDVEEGQRAVEQEASHEPISPGARLDLAYALALLRVSKPPCVDRLWDHYILGLDYSEMAALYQLTVDAVRMQIRRCLELAQALVSKAP